MAVLERLALAVRERRRVADVRQMSPGCAVRRQAGARRGALRHSMGGGVAGSSNPGSANHERPLHAETLRRSVPAACLEALRARFGDRFSESAAVRSIMAATSRRIP